MQARHIDFITNAGLWIITKLLDIFVTFPISFVNHFKKPKKIPKIKSELLLIPANILARKIRNQEIKSTQVIQAYIDRIKEVNPIINAVIEDRFNDAIEEAAKADAIITGGELSEEEIEIQYPLLGIPITIKGSVAVKDMLLVSGRKFPDPEKRRSKYNAHAIDQLRKAGAIVLVISSTPEYCINIETRNMLIGDTVNPYDTRRVVGGSSGGEGALVSSGCSVIGIGSDLGGSVRIPSHFCGIYGHKPTVEAVDYHGHLPESRNVEIWSKMLTLGPMVRYPSDLSFLLNLTIQPEKRPLLNLDAKVDIKKLKVYYLYSHETIHSHAVEKDIILNMEKAIKHLQSVTASVQKVKIDELETSSTLATNFLLRVGDIDDIFDNDENRSAVLELIKKMFGLSNHTLFGILFVLLTRTIKKPISQDVLKFYDEKVSRIRTQFDDILDENAVFICPTLPCTAYFVGQAGPKYGDSGYTSIFSVLGYPVTNCPIGFDSKGLPIGIQIVGNINCDRLTIALATELHTVFGGWHPSF